MNLTNFLTSSPEASIVAGVILFGALIIYIGFIWPAEKSTAKDLKSLTAISKKYSGDWELIKEQAQSNINQESAVAGAWQETVSRVMKITLNKKEKNVIYGIPRDLWNSQGLLARRSNIGLIEAAPNILVGLGLLMTFLFLSFALMEATSVLTDASTSKDTESAINQLLRFAGSKFLTSLTGLTASILWTIRFRYTTGKINNACDDLLKSLEKSLYFSAAEMISMQQLFLTKEKIQNNIDTNDFIQELLIEAREQTGTFKRFETDLAVSLAGAINQAFTPQMQAMTEQLVRSIEGLSEKIGTMNQEALRSMMEDFASMLKKATDSEMQQLQQSLQELSSQLHGAGAALEQQSGIAANAILNAGVEMQSQLKGAAEMLNVQTTEIATNIQNAGMQLATYSQEISEKLSQGATELEQAAASIRIGFKELGEVVEHASVVGKEGIVQAHTALESADFTVAQLAKVTSELLETTQSLSETSSLVTNIFDNVQELAREQRAVVLSVKEVAPNAMAAVSRVTEVLDQAAAQTLSSMQQTREAMETTAVTLGKTVDSITEGVTSYSTQVADLHRQMDGQLAKAVGSFDQGVKDLSEVIEEMTENFESSFQAVRK